MLSSLGNGSVGSTTDLSSVGWTTMASCLFQRRVAIPGDGISLCVAQSNAASAKEYPHRLLIGKLLRKPRSQFEESTLSQSYNSGNYIYFRKQPPFFRLYFYSQLRDVTTMIKDMFDKQVIELKKLWANKRQLLFQLLNLAMIVFSALMIWKGLMFLTKVGE